MSRECFLYLCDQLRPEIQQQSTHLRKPVVVQQRLAITIWCMATCADYRTIGHLFGVAKCTVCTIIHDTCAAFVKVFLSRIIKFPTEEALKRTIAGFDLKWQFIQCAGAIDGCNIPVKPPSQHHTDYYNRKGWYSVILQAVVDHDYLFMDIMVGWPGSVHDARVLANSDLYQKATDKQILNSESRRILEKNIYPFLIGDSAYPLTSWIMKPFPCNSALSHSQKQFNYRLSRARIVVENAFGRLKARWRRLMKQNDMNICNVPNVVATCCILHNICESRGETFIEGWSEEARQEDPPSTSTSAASSSQAKDIRETLVQYYSGL